MSLLLKHYSLNRQETVRGWRGAPACSCPLEDEGWRQTPHDRSGEDESEPKCAIMKMSLDAARKSKRLAQPHASCLGGVVENE